MPVHEAIAQFFRYFHPRRLRLWQWLTLFVVGLFIAVRFWLPGFLRQQITARLTAATSAQVQLGDVDLTLIRGRVAVKQLSLTLNGEEQPVILIGDLAINLRLRSLLRGQISIEEVHLTRLQVEAVREADGQFNLTRLFLSSSAEQEPPSSDLPTLVVQQLRLSDSQVMYRDLTRRPEARFSLTINNLTTNEIRLQSQGLGVPVTAQIDGVLEGSPLRGTTQTLWQHGQMAIDAEVEAQQLALTTIAPYLHDLLALQQLSGYLGTQLRYRYHSGGEQPLVHTLDGTLTLQQVRFADPTSGQTLLDLPAGQAALEKIDFHNRDIHLALVELKNPKLFLLRTASGLNVASLMRTQEQSVAKQLSEGRTESPWRFSLQAVKWTGGEIIYRESVWPEKEAVTLSPEEIHIENLGNGVTEHPFHFRTRLGEGSVAGEGQLGFAPFALQAQVQPAEVDVDVLRPLLAPLLADKSLQGKVTGTIQTELTDKDGTQVVRVSGILETAQFTIDAIPEAGSSAGWEKGHLEIGEGSTALPLSVGLKTELSQFSLHRATQGNISIEKVNGDLYLVEPTAAGGKQIVTVNGTLDTTKLTLNGVPEPVNILAWENGHMEISEGSTVMPLVLDLKAQLSQISLLHLPQGEVTIEKANGSLQLAQEVGPQQETRLRTQGAVEVSSFALTRESEKQILLGCYHGQAKINQGSYLIPLDLRLQEVALEYTYAQGLRTPSGQLQLFIPGPGSQESAPPSSVSTSDTTLQPSPVPSTAATSSPSIQIDRVKIIGGELYFEDRTVTPPQTVYWQDVKIDLSKVGYPLVLPTVFSGHAYNEDGAPVEFKGTTERQGGQTIVRVHGQVQKISLSRFNGYLAPSLGYRVKKGAISATWDLVLPGDRLQANMQVTLHDLGLGGKQDSSALEQQVGLPLTLVIALLKDLNGDINLQLPVEGRMNEPGFQWEGTILRAVRDVLIGAVMSPLKVLGAVFKGKDTLEGFTLEPIQFVPGTNQMTDTGKVQLSRLAQFLAQRPELDLRFSGSVGPDEVSLLKDQQILSQLPVSPIPPELRGSAVVEQQKEAAPQVSPQDEVRQFLMSELEHPGTEATLVLSAQATELLTQLRKQTVVPADASAGLAAERVQAVISELATHYAVPATRLSLNPEKQRGPGAAEVRYVIQTREERGEKKAKS